MGCTCSSPKVVNPVGIALDQLIASETIVLFRKDTELCNEVENILKTTGVRYRAIELQNRADGDALLCALKNRLQTDDDAPFLFVDLIFTASKKQVPKLVETGDLVAIAERIKALHQKAAERNA